MKKVLSLVLALTMVFAFTLTFTGCGGSDSEEGSGDAAFKAGFICLHDENSTYDKNFIDAANKACEELGIRCINLVPEREDIPRMTRVARAHKIMKDNPGKQCYYISIHINAAGHGDKWYGASGFAVYVSKNASDKSKELAKNIYDTAYDFGLYGNRSIPKEHYWQANYDVIYYTKCPAILTENLFQDNRAEVEYLKSEKGKEAICNYHLIGICKTIGIPYGLVIA